MTFQRTDHQRGSNARTLWLNSRTTSRLLILILAVVVADAENVEIEEPVSYGQSLTRYVRDVDGSSAITTPEFIRAEPDLTPVVPINDHGKRRQYIPAPVIPMAGPPLPAAGQCPGGPSLPVECDPKRPWPQCPPQSYCYATNSVDIGPYFCCPVWSTYGAAWRPATPFYNYVPPPPPNWNPVLRAAVGQWPASAIGLPPFHRSRRPVRLGVDNDGPPPEQLRHMISVMNDWIQRENDHEKETTELSGSGAEPSQANYNLQEPATEEHKRL
ncbi:hypothetical protein M3Y94_01114200 [Aphelenchoides besseyi]|nr:hypothetical protein M3Y94_01114200 [Aphelenchoides besseyi]KAI6216782.1 hypothetical protein M3Y95_01257500 [Aphelenchoides besseyi]